jgi:cytochrome c-type biogenesis protein CcmE
MQPRYVIGSLLIMGSLGFLVVTSMRSGAMKSIPVGELRADEAKGQSFVGQRMRLVGFVGKEPVSKTPMQTTEGTINVAKFKVVEGKDSVLVSYSDALPDTFRAGGPVQVDGVYKAPGLIEADHVLTKCPSKYQAGESAVKQSEKKPGSAKLETAQSPVSSDKS